MLRKSIPNLIICLLFLGLFVTSVKADSKSFKEAIKKAKLGDGYAQFDVGLMYYVGYGVAKDHREAARWYLLSAKNGIATAQMNLGLMYESGDGVRQDSEKALAWLTKAAKQDLPEAQFNLGLLYANGLGAIAKDYNKAMHWFQLSAMQGIPIAQYNLGLSYAYGRGVSRDKVQGAAWLLVAYASGYEEAERVLIIQRDKLTGPEIEKAKKIANSFWGKIYNAETFKKRIEKNSTDYIALYELGKIYNSQNKFRKALENFLACSSVNPSFAEAYFGIGHCCLKLNDRYSAIDAHIELISLNKGLADRLAEDIRKEGLFVKDPKSIIDIARDYYARKKYNLSVYAYRDAISILEKDTRRNSDMIGKTYYELKEAFSAMGDGDNAYIAGNKALEFGYRVR